MSSFEGIFAVTPAKAPTTATIPPEFIPVPPLRSDFVDHLPTRCVDDPRVLPDRERRTPCSAVFDLDETLVTARDGRHVVIRPYARYLLEQLVALRLPVEHPADPTVVDDDAPRAVEIIVWSAGVRQHVDRCLRLLDPAGVLVDHAICRGESWLPLQNLDRVPAGFFGIALKDLSMLPGRAGSSFLVDDSAYAAVRSGGRAVLVPPFKPTDPTACTDTALLFVLQFVTFVALVLGADRMDRAADLVDSASATASATSGASAGRRRRRGGRRRRRRRRGGRGRRRRGRTSSASAVDSADTRSVTPPVTPQSCSSSPTSDGPQTPVFVAARTCRVLRMARRASASQDHLLATAEDASDRAAFALATVATRVLRAAVQSGERGDSADAADVDFDRVYEIDHPLSSAQLDAAGIPSVLREHPFLTRRFIDTPHGQLAALVLDVVDETRLGTRIVDFLNRFAPVADVSELSAAVRAVRTCSG